MAQYQYGHQRPKHVTNLINFLNEHCMVRVEKTGSNGNTPPLIERRATHVSTIGKFKDSRAGAFCISEESLDEFYKLVDNAVKYDGWKDYSISESISDLEAMPVIIDLDMKKKLPKSQLDPTKTEKENTEAHRMYKLEDIMELTQYYISYLRVYLDDLPETSQAVYILEKEYPTIERNTQPRGQLGIHDGEAVTLGGNGNNDPPCKLINGSYYEIKDGVHIIMPNIVVKRGLQLHIRQKMLENERVKEILNGFQSSESIENIFDKNTIVSAPWPMYGARKQKYKLPYLLTVCYQLKRITEDVTSPRVQLVEGENYVDFTNTVRYKASQDEGYLIKLLSVRNKSSQGYGGYPIKAEFIQQLNNVLKDASGRARRDAAAARLPRSAVTKKDPMELRNIIKYVACLGSKRATTRSTWLQVGWCLYNLHNADSTLLNVWISFSKKSENPRHVSECEEVCPKEWEAMRLDKLGMGSLKLWAQEDNPGMYETICRDDIYHQLLYGKSFKKATAIDFAKIVHSMYKDHHICINVLKNIWYYYHAERHIWVRDDGAAELDRKIPDEVYSRINYICEQEIGTEYRHREQESRANRLIEDVRIDGQFAIQQYLQSLDGGGVTPAGSQRGAVAANDPAAALLQSMPPELLSTMSAEQIRLLLRQGVEQRQQHQPLHQLTVNERQSLDVRQQIVSAQLKQQMERLEQEVANRDYNNNARINYGQSQSRILEFKKKLDDIRETTFKSHILKECKVLFYKTDVSQNFICNLDTNTNILVCKNGVLDLLAGEMRDGRPEDFMSLSTRIEYKPLIEHNRDIIDAVDKFLESIYIVKDVRDFIKYLMSTFLTGSTKNESFAVLTGRGSNGKSKIFKLLTRALGEYAKPINVVIFTSKRPGQGQATPDFAQLKGVRLAIAEEPENNTDGTSPAINGGIIKEFTGDGAGLNVRPLYSENIVIHLQTKLLLGANHKLRVDASDEAIRRRLNNIEHMTRFLNFDTGYLEDDWMHFWRDDDLGIDLWGEVFLSMLVDEFLWRRKTPKPLIPAEIQYYSRNYFNIFDEIKMFWDDCIVYTSSSKDSIDFRVLYNEYKNWFFNERDKNAKPMSIDKFTFQAKRRHPDCLTRTKKTIFNGIRIRQVGEEDVPNNQYNSDSDNDNDNGTHRDQPKKMGKSSSRFGAKNMSMFSNDKRSVDQIYSDRFKFRETYDFDIDCVPTFIFLKYDRDRVQQTILFQGAHPLHRAVFFLPKFVQEYLASGDQYEFRFGVLIPPENEDSARVVKSWTLMPVCTQEERIETVRSQYMKQIEMFRDMMDIYVYEDPVTLCISERYKYRPDYRFFEVIPRAYDEVKNKLESKIENVLSKLHERIMSERGGFGVDYDQMHIDSEGGVFADSDHMDMELESESSQKHISSSRKRMRVFEEEDKEEDTHNGSFPKRRVVLSDSNIIDTNDLLSSIQNNYSDDEEDEE